jgi:hypothetical protein
VEIQQERGTRIIPNHALDNVGNPSKAFLPPSRPSLTSYSLEYRGALRMIRVFIFSNDLIPQGAGPGYIALSLQCEPLDQTDLRNDGDAS